MFNSQEFEWSNVNVFMLDRLVTGIQGISYSVKQEKEFVYGQGKNPRAIQSGNRSYEGEIKVLQSELEALIKSARDRDILKLRFDIIVSYVPGLETGEASAVLASAPKLVTDVLKFCEFSEIPKSLSQGDKMMEVALPIMFLDIKYNNA